MIAHPGPRQLDHARTPHRFSPRLATLPLAVSLLALGACDAASRVDGATEASWRTLEVARQLHDTAARQVRVDYTAGRLDVHGADSALLYAMSLRYDEARTDPVHRLEGNGRTLELGVRPHDDAHSGGGDAGEMQLALTRRIPLDLGFELGAVDADLDLGGLAVESLAIRSGASEARLRFEEPNRVPMRRLAIDVGAASVRASDLANANAAEIQVGAGVGAVELDFGGRWTRDVAARVKVTFGSVTVHVPADVGVRLDADRVLASFDTDGLVKRGDAYYSANWETAPHKLRLDVDTVVGRFELDHAAP